MSDLELGMLLGIGAMCLALFISAPVIRWLGDGYTIWRFTRRK